MCVCVYGGWGWEGGGMVNTSTPEVTAITAGSLENTLVLTSVASHWYHYRWLRESEIFLTS